MPQKSTTLKTLCTLILIFDLFVFILALNGYHIAFVIPSMNTFTLFLITAWACYRLLNMTKLKKLNAIFMTFWIIIPILLYPTSKYIWKVGLWYDSPYHTYDETIFPFIVKEVENGERE